MLCAGPLGFPKTMGLLYLEAGAQLIAIFDKACDSLRFRFFDSARGAESLDDSRRNVE
jgi:hypothetical protein